MSDNLTTRNRVQRGGAAHHNGLKYCHREDGSRHSDPAAGEHGREFATVAAGKQLLETALRARGNRQLLDGSGGGGERRGRGTGCSGGSRRSGQQCSKTEDPKLRLKKANRDRRGAAGP